MDDDGMTDAIAIAGLTWGMLEAGLLIGVWEFGEMIFQPRWRAGRAVAAAVAAPLVLGWLRLVHPAAVPWAVFAVAVMAMWAWLPTRWSILGTGVTIAVWGGIVGAWLHQDEKAWLGALSLAVLGGIAPVARRYQPKRWAAWSGLYAIAVIAVLAISRLNGDTGADAINTAVVALFAGVYTFGQAARTRAWALSRRQAEEDALTGALTRRGGSAWLNAHQGLSGVVMALDLDDFKWFNDTWGHSAGDAVLVEAVARMRSVLRAPDALVRSGGDEFLIWVPNVSLSAGMALVERVHQAVTGVPLTVQDHVTTVGCSLGWAAGPLTDVTAEAADQALLVAKRQGKNQIAGPDRKSLSDVSGPLMSTHLLTSVVEALWNDWPHAAVLTDVDGHILTCNAAYERLTGRDRQALRDRKPGINSAGHTPQSVYEALWHHLVHQQPWRGLLLNRRPDGTVWWANEEISPVRLGPRLMGYWAHVRDPLVPNPESPAWPLVDWAMMSLTPVFQPLMQIGQEYVWGYEALIRGELEGVAVAPSDLFQLAASTGTTVDLDHRALNAVAEVLHAVDWPGEAVLSVNMRLQTLADTRWVREWLSTLPVPLHRIIIEISEQDSLPMAFSSWSTVRKAVPAVAFAIDDWGAGHNEVTRLFDLQPEWIKVDRSWLQAARQQSGPRSLLTAFATWARNEGSRIILEGVETPEDLEVAQRCAIDYGQGFLWGKPEIWSNLAGR
ncbi:MAG: hypothetical protein C7B45_05485 [Sulfobacillus acidophilus]|uniref:Diguanylate cyclase n=1 Tax=Sulfobacillus acidophilus TaxID=53633 RepID=A0A2T2WKK7_9FIRM|nr:MAG: hypothetical protein C7B45_05485 [Sulfobacillus acidophilus]